MISAAGLGEDRIERAASIRDLPRFSDQAVRSLASEIDQSGFAILPAYVSPEALEELQDVVRQRVFTAGGEYAAFDGREAVAGTLLGELPDRPEFVSLLRRLYELATAKAAPKQAIHQVLRCLAGRTGLKHCFIFHYDSYVVTLLLPILIPTKGEHGRLIMWPNLRRIRPAYLLNLLDKLFIDNRLTQLVLKRLFLSGRLKLREVEMVPGNLYLFWGYRTLHANAPCDPQNIRSTALFHFGDPHGESRLRRNMGRVAV